MYRYQTKSFGVIIPFNPAGVKEMWLTFVQDDIVINRTKEQLSAELATVKDKGDGRWEFQFAFTQTESGNFSANSPIEAQVRWSNGMGHSDATNIYSFWLKDVLMEGEI